MQITRTLLVLIGITLSVAPANGQTIKVEAGDVDRVESPMRATVKLAQPLPGMQASLGSAGSQPIEAQLAPVGDGTFQLMWIEPKLAAGQSRSYQLNVAPAQPRAGFAFENKDGYRDLTYAGKGVLR